MKLYKFLGVSFLTVTIFYSCDKYLPEKRENIGTTDSQFNQTVYQPVLGRTTVYNNNFFMGSSSIPSEFKIVNMRHASTGDSAVEMYQNFPVTVWKSDYTGKEKSVAEIEAKKEIQYRRVFEIGQGSGTFTMWSMGRASFIKALPDSGYLFDVEVSNSGGRRYFKDLKLQPLRERLSEPSNLDEITGQPISPDLKPVNPTTLLNVMGDSTNTFLGLRDVQVTIRKISDESGSTTPILNKLTFRFLDKSYRPINPDKFSGTDWVNLIHGFNMQKTSTGVTYDVSYPMPATTLVTPYTNFAGTAANINFRYSRVNQSGLNLPAILGLNFAIFENGNWEILFVFTKDNPRFTND